MLWRLSHRYDRPAVEMADRHYSRQKVGSPQFMPAGSCLVLHAETETGRAVWGTSFPLEEYTHHEWAGAWMCSIFRNEGAARSSILIRQAIAATRAHYGEPPSKGMVTFVKEDAVRAKRDPGHCFIIAGFRPVGRTKKRGYLALQILPNRMPKAEQPVDKQLTLL